MSKRAKLPPSFPALVQAYFAEYLTQQRALSAQTIAAYRDGFVLFLGFAESRLGKSPAAMALADITPELIMAFLDHLERPQKVGKNAVLVFRCKVDVLYFDADHIGDGGCVHKVNIGRAIAGFIFRRPRRAVIVLPVFHEDSDNLMALLLQNVSSHCRIDATAEAYHYALLTHAPILESSCFFRISYAIKALSPRI